MGIPLTVGFRPQLVVISGLSVEILWRWDLGHNLLLSQAFRWESLWRWDLCFHGAVGYHEAFHELSVSHDGIFLSRSLSRTFSFTRWKFGYHGAFHDFSFTRWNFNYHGAFHDFSFTRWNFGCHRAFHDFFFHMMEFRLSRSLLKPCRDTWWSSRDTWSGGRLFSYISQRVFT
jgi:hypothetical protein